MVGGWRAPEPHPVLLVHPHIGVRDEEQLDPLQAPSGAIDARELQPGRGVAGERDALEGEELLRVRITQDQPPAFFLDLQFQPSPCQGALGQSLYRLGVPYTAQG